MSVLIYYDHFINIVAYGVDSRSVGGSSSSADTAYYTKGHSFETYNMLSAQHIICLYMFYCIYILIHSTGLIKSIV